MKQLIKKILKETQKEKKEKLIFDYLNEYTNGLLVDKSGSFLTFVWKLQWDNRFEDAPIVFNYHQKKSSIDFGPFWENNRNYPILTVHPPLIDSIDGLFGEGNEKIVGDWFQEKYNLPVKTVNWSEF